MKYYTVIIPARLDGTSTPLHPAPGKLNMQGPFASATDAFAWAQQQPELLPSDYSVALRLGMPPTNRDGQTWQRWLTAHGITKPPRRTAELRRAWLRCAPPEK